MKPFSHSRFVYKTRIILIQYDVKKLLIVSQYFRGLHKAAVLETSISQEEFLLMFAEVIWIFI